MSHNLLLARDKEVSSEAEPESEISVPARPTHSKSMPAPNTVCNEEAEAWEIDFQEFPEHLKFLTKLRNAQVNANKTGKRAQICWRGHRTSLSPKPGNGTFTKRNFLQRLIAALKSIKSVKKEETEVSFSFSLYIYILFFCGIHQVYIYISFVLFYSIL